MTIEEWKCSGCGIESPARLRACDCITNVLYKSGNEHSWKLERNEGRPLLPSYLEQMRAHVEEGGHLSHRNGLDLLAEVERARLNALEGNRPKARVERTKP